MAQSFDLDRLTEHLGRAGALLAPLYVVAGDEPLLVTEAADALRGAARAAGYTDRSSLLMDARSDWSAITAALYSGSLFGGRRLLEIKLPTGKPGKTGGETLTQLAEQIGDQPNPEVLVVIALPRLDKTTRETRWARALAHAGVMVDLNTIERSRLPEWIEARLARQNQRVVESTLHWLADKVEGNLLAAHQEIQKLHLLYPEGDLAAADVERAVLDVARYDVFDLRDAMLAGDAARVVRVIAGLRAEGEALPLVLWAVGEEIRLLARLSQARAQTQNLGELMRRLRIFGSHERLAQQALARVPAGAWPTAVQHAHEVDRLIKGLAVPGRLLDPWEEMTRLALRIAAAGRS
jgi:DNA polymerase-3 subunit delta